MGDLILHGEAECGSLWVPDGEKERWWILEGRASQDFQVVCESLQPNIVRKQGHEDKLRLVSLF